MKHLMLLVCLGLVAMVLPACEDEELSWDEGFRDIKWEAEDADAPTDDDCICEEKAPTDEMVVTCRNLHLIRYRRENDEMTFGPAEGEGLAEAVEAYRLFYGFNDHEFFEVLVYADASQYDQMVAIFAEYFGTPVQTGDQVTYYRRGEVAGRVKMAQNFFRKVEGRLTYIPLAQRYQRQAQESQMAWEDSAISAPLRR